MEEKHRAAWRLARLGVYIGGLAVLCAGIVLNTKTGLGVAPINSLPYLAAQVSPVSLGQATTIMYTLFVVLQCVLKRRLALMVVLQLPLSYGFGLLVDCFDELLDVVQPESLAGALFWLGVAAGCTALGIVLVVGMDLAPNPPDGMVQTLSQVLGKEFGLTKNCFDLAIVALAALGGLCFAHALVGIGAGTVINALLVGRLASLFREGLGGGMERIKKNSG